MVFRRFDCVQVKVTKSTVAGTGSH